MLYIVGTPIGNLDDLSLRQAKILMNSEIILTEDTRSTGLLLGRMKSMFNLTINQKQKLISYYKEKEFEKLPEILSLINQDKTISLISESGMPLISDPGSLLIQTLVKRNISFTVIPGPTAAITALVYSGIKFDSFMFFGFLPKKSSQLFQSIRTLEKIINILPKTVFIFYESAQRINKTLSVINEILPEAKIVIGRELTKKFEEIIRGKAQDLLSRSYKGELTIILQ
jgi:16S rRNA (cytidine1402-2'-O)-methyltransferase